MSTRTPGTQDRGDPGISPEHFIAEHTFVYVVKGTMHCYDGNRMYTFRSDSPGLARKNGLARYKKEKEDDRIEKIFIGFDEGFLKEFQARHKVHPGEFKRTDSFIPIKMTGLLAGFIRSMSPYYKGGGKIDPKFQDVKREELLLILLQAQPELAGAFFDFGPPEKIPLEEFMNRNYKFNISIRRFAYLTGRSLSAFKRDFYSIFKETPSRWLMKRRLQEAYFLIDKKAQKPSDIFLDLGFESLAHFSSAFKKQFRITPTHLSKPGVQKPAG